MKDIGKETSLIRLLHLPLKILSVFLSPILIFWMG